MTELDDKKLVFERQSPVVPRNLAWYLRRQQSLLPDRRLWPDHSDLDLAVWAHGCANVRGADGVTVEPPAGTEPAHRLIAPLMPPALQWGAGSHFQNYVVSALDSPVIHAWLYRDENKAITEAVLVGAGIPSIRAQVIAAVLSCFLAVEPHINNFVLDGLIRLTLAKPADEPGEDVPKAWYKRLSLPFHHTPGAEVVIPESAAEAMLLLQGALKRLQDDTGFVQLHVVPASHIASFHHALAEYRRKASGSDQAYLWVGKGEPGALDVVTSLPVQRLSGVGVALRLELSADLLDAPPYRELAETYHAALIQDVLQDVRRRERFYTEMLDQHQTAKDWYASLSAKEKSELPDVFTDHEIDWETGLLVRLPTPGRVPAKSFYTENMDYKIREDTKWLEMMRRLQKRIDYIVNHGAAPLQRIIAARLFDAAMRDRHISEAPAISSLFESWKKLVQPVLWLEWRRLLEQEGIDSRAVSNRHTTFNISIDESSGKLFLFPHSVVDSCRSVGLFERTQKVVFFLDANDYATQADELDCRNAARARLQEARGMTDTRALREKLIEAIALDPQSVAQAIVNEWLPGENHSDGFEQIRAAALTKVGSTHAALSALRWINESCFQSAEEVLAKVEESIQHPTVLDAAAILMQAHLKCFQAGHLPSKTFPEILSNKTVSQELMETANLVWQANKLNPEMVSQFVRQGILAPRASLPPDAPRATAGEEGAIASLAAVEAARAVLAIDRALESLHASSETRRTAFYKLVPVMEQCFALEYASPPGSMGELLELLVGEKRDQGHK